MKKITTQEFITRVKAIHGKKYDYTHTNYVTMQVKVSVYCVKHNNTFTVSPVKHLGGQGCPKCKTEKMSALHQIDTDQFIRRATAIHGAVYDYSNTEYVDNKTKVEIICSTHGSWLTSPNNHTNKANKCGCPECGKDKIRASKLKNTTWFVNKAKEIHGDTFDYSVSEYTEWFAPIQIGCRTHGIFDQKAHQHFATAVCCPQCTTSVSKGETEWLDYLGIQNGFRQKRLFIGGKHVLVDAIDYRTKTIYEFYGDYWHGNPSTMNHSIVNDRASATFGELYLKTLERERILKENGYQVVAIWESDWNLLKRSVV